MPKMQDLPSYKRPPVVEVVWGAQFPRLSWLTGAHLGLLWARFREDYPCAEEHEPISRAHEPEEWPSHQPLVSEDRTGNQSSRQWFVSESGCDLIQFQKDRLFVNWRKVKDSDAYPRFGYIKNRFQRVWEAFAVFCKEQGKDVVFPDLLEMAYVNIIPKGEAWSEPADLGKVFPWLSIHGNLGDLPTPGSFKMNMIFDLRGKAGRLHADCSHVLRKDQEKAQAFRLNLMYRGQFEGERLDDIMGWYDEAHAEIVRAFSDLTDSDMQEGLWGRQDQ